MELITEVDHEGMSRAAAEWLQERVRETPESLLALATGATPRRLYKLLAQAHGAGELDSSRLRIIQLDEWGGFSSDSPHSCRGYLERHVLGPLDIPPERSILFIPDAGDPALECRRVSGELALAGPIHIAIVGIGINGHLGLNEPADSLPPGCHVAKLSRESLSHGMLREAAAPPTHGMTLGLREILFARRVLLLASGAHKAGVLARMIRGEVTTRFPASFLRLHPRVSIFCDQEAASQL